MKRPFKVWRPTRTGPLPERLTLEQAAARELLTTWEVTKNKELVDRHLARLDKVYGEGAEQRVRQHMRDIARYERLA